MEKILVKMEKMEKILVILEKTKVMIPFLCAPLGDPGARPAASDPGPAGPVRPRRSAFQASWARADLFEWVPDGPDKPSKSAAGPSRSRLSAPRRRLTDYYRKMPKLLPNHA